MKRTFLTLLLCFAVFRVEATDYSDIWWNPAESGWGVNFAQSNRYIFATFFVYGAGHEPIWYAAGMTLDAGGNFAGPLYATTGPWFGTNPFSIAEVTTTPVGGVEFRPTAADAGILTYNVTGVTVAKNIQRQTLTPIALSGSYMASIAGTASQCAASADDGPFASPILLSVAQSPGGQLQVEFDFFGLGTCTMSGPSIQAGQLFRIPAAAWTCSDGSGSTAKLDEIKATSLGIEGRWAVANTGGNCRMSGVFSGVPQ